MTILWKSGDRWPGDLRHRIDGVGGILVLTHRATAHELRRSADGRLVWTRTSRGGHPYSPFHPTGIGSVTPCGFSVVGVGMYDWHCTSRCIWIATADVWPDSDELDELVAAGTPPVDGHGPLCDAVYCQQVPDNGDARAAHLLDLLHRINASTESAS